MPTLPVDRHADAMWRAGYRQGRADQRARTGKRPPGVPRWLRAALAAALAIWVTPTVHAAATDALAACAMLALACVAYAYVRWPVRRDEWL